MSKIPAILTVVAILSFGVSAYAQSDTAAIIETGSGTMVLEFFPDDAPAHVENFINLASDDFYSGTIFHRIIPDFMIQGGDPNTKPDLQIPPLLWGQGGPNHTVNAEFSDLNHVRGIVSMARSQDPDSAGSQFFIMHAPAPHLDGQYSIFGRLITQESFETLDKIAALETEQTAPINPEPARIISVTIVPKSTIPDVLAQPPPPRSTSPDMPFSERPYENTRLGVKFTAPAGWNIQEPPKTTPETPDIALLPLAASGISPYISITISPSNGRTLDDRIQELDMIVQAAIDEGSLDLILAEKTELAGRPSYVILANSSFDTGVPSGIVPIKYNDITFVDQDKFYSLTFASADQDYLTNSPAFDLVVNTFDTGARPPTQASSEGNVSVTPSIKSIDDSDNGCLVATAAYGTELAPQVQMLRELRDNIIYDTASGTAFMAGFNSVYYMFSPAIADMERQNPALRDMVRAAITPLLSSLMLLHHLEIDSELEMLTYGSAIIALNAGMYIAAPAFIVHRIARYSRQQPSRPQPAF